MAVSKIEWRMWLRHKLFVLSPMWFAAILVFQQLFDLVSTIYLTSLAGGVEANPILAPLWDAPGGVWWLVSAKLWMCLLIILGVPYLIRESPEIMWLPKLICLMYWPLIFWNAYLVVSTMP